MRFNLVESVLVEDADDDEIAELQARIKEIEARKAARAEKEAQEKAREDSVKETEVYKQVRSVLEDKELDTEAITDKLFNILVPASGNAGTQAGELIRAINKILYRDYNDGDVFYEGYGIETCGNAMAYIVEILEEYGQDIYPKLEDIAGRMLEDDDYTRSIYEIADIIIDVINAHTAKLLQESHDDMYDSDESIIKTLEPLYEAQFNLPDDLSEALENYIIPESDIEGEIHYWEVSGNTVGYIADRISVDYDSVYVSDVPKDMYNELERNGTRWLQQWWDDVRSEYESDNEDDDYDYEDDDLEESLLSEALSIEDAKRKIDQFPHQITIKAEAEDEFKDFLLSKNISFMIDDHLTADGKHGKNSTFHLKYPRHNNSISRAKATLDRTEEVVAESLNETAELDKKVSILRKKISMLDDLGYKEGYDKVIISNNIKDTIENHLTKYKDELAKIYDSKEFFEEDRLDLDEALGLEKEYIVYFVNTADKQAKVKVKAINKEEAKKQAKKETSEIYKIIEVQEA